MPRLFLPSILCERGGGIDAPLEVEGGSVGAVFDAACERHPALRRWVVDEAGHLRQHVKVFVNEREAGLDTSVEPADEVHVVPAISGG
ncbi:MAG TPA: MoaD/ThiS family protein [Thermoanaerobaculia bacterium]|nr:MoaD/ThiS family protein [Thermoanaerobaculia bacterium]